MLVSGGGGEAVWDVEGCVHGWSEWVGGGSSGQCIFKYCSRSERRPLLLSGKVAGILVCRPHKKKVMYANLKLPRLC